MTRLVLDEILDPSEVRVVVERGPDGRAVNARFSLADLPRVEPLLVGRPVARIPSFVERLCGLCPAAHHLAGVRALEALAGIGPVSAQAEAVRRLLHHGSAIQAHTERAGTLGGDAAAVGTLATFARSVLAAAGMPSHFPTTAMPGGVTVRLETRTRDTLGAMLPGAMAAAQQLALASLGTEAGTAHGVEGGRASHELMPFTGADVALVTSEGRPDLLGTRLRVVAADGTVLHDAEPVERFDAVLAEQWPGTPAPRPYLRELGPDGGRYRVGPVAQLRMAPLDTPLAAQLQERWVDGARAAAAARAIMAVAAVEAVGRVLADPALCQPPEPAVDLDVLAHVPAGAVGVGWVDGPRGLLVHRYVAGDEGTLRAATILTPTAQNEPWLAELLRQATAGAETGQGAGGGLLERAVREADPCLPCTAAPPGAMRLTITDDAAADTDGTIAPAPAVDIVEGP